MGLEERLEWRRRIVGAAGDNEALDAVLDDYASAVTREAELNERLHCIELCEDVREYNGSADDVAVLIRARYKA